MSLRYPYKKIESSDDYLQIDVVEYKPPGLGSQQEGSFALNTSDQTYADLGGTNSKIKIFESIILPIPDDIKDQNVAKWGESELGPLSAGIAQGTVNLMDKGILDTFKGAPNKLSEIISALNTLSGQSAVQGKLASKAVQAVLGRSPGELISRIGGITFNQNIEVIFSGLKLREPFTFSFDIVPRSEREAKEVKDIIRTFKKYSSVKKGLEAEAGAGLFLKAPEVFRLRYMTGGKPHPFLNKFKICALIGMSVNYTANGTYATYADATPVNMNLTLSFQELTPIFFEDYTDTDTTVGY